jgi:DNA adenine methylase
MLIPYLGEKSKFSNFIIPNIPDDFDTYVEPFGGMFGIFFGLDFTKHKNVNFVYNDINFLNYNLFNQLKNNNDFLLKIKNINIDKNEYLKSIKKLTLNKNLEQLAIDWLIVLTCSSPYEIGKDSWRGESEFEIFKIKYKAYKYHIDKITSIENLNYIDVINKWDSKSAFFYVDPPYYGKEKYYINHDFNKNSHKELADVLNNIKGKFLLSYYYFDGIEELYQGCRFEERKTIMGTELIIMNF